MYAAHNSVFVNSAVPPETKMVNRSCCVIEVAFAKGWCLGCSVPRSKLSDKAFMEAWQGPVTCPCCCCQSPPANIVCLCRQTQLSSCTLARGISFWFIICPISRTCHVGSSDQVCFIIGLYQLACLSVIHQFPGNNRSAEQFLSSKMSP
jgi:hypothetical protein